MRVVAGGEARRTHKGNEVDLKLERVLVNDQKRWGPWCIVHHDNAEILSEGDERPDKALLSFAPIQS